MGFPGAHNVRRRPQGLGVARDVSAPRIGVLPFLTHDREPVPVSGSSTGHEASMLAIVACAHTGTFGLGRSSFRGCVCSFEKTVCK
jgi:hypothetical protein